MIDILITHQHEIIKGLGQTFLMLMISTLSAIIIGLPLGTIIFLTKKDGVYENLWLHKLLNGLVNIIRSFPFLLFIFAMIPITRFVIGRSLGTVAASFPLSFIAAALYSRFVEQALMEVPKEITDTALSLGADTKSLLFDFLYVEAKPSLILGLTSSMVSFVSYSTVMGVVGGGGIGDFAMIYGYQRYQYDVMYTAIIIMILLVQIIQFTGNSFARKADKR
ncbi:MAG TPA: methionine ABC transporter permease [Erysipelothrix sp.]